jgi:hypothetical protein
MRNIATAEHAAISRRAALRRILLATALAVVSALLVTIAIAPQAHAQTLNPAAQLAVLQTDASALNALTREQCGYIPDGWYNHCGDIYICIWVDMKKGEDEHDFPRKVGPGFTDLGQGVQNAWYVGLPPCGH